VLRPGHQRDQGHALEVTTDQAPVYPAVLEDLLPVAWHRTEQYANNGIECDHGRLKARLRPMRGLNQDCSARAVVAGHAFMQNLRRGHYELAVEEPANRRVAVASKSWPRWSDARGDHGFSPPCVGATQQRPLA
jgi:transposase-like protein